MIGALMQGKKDTTVKVRRYPISLEAAGVALWQSGAEGTFRKAQRYQKYIL
jgi:hypothetical protein